MIRRWLPLLTDGSPLDLADAICRRRLTIALYATPTKHVCGALGCSHAPDLYSSC